MCYLMNCNNTYIHYFTVFFLSKQFTVIFSWKTLQNMVEIDKTMPKAMSHWSLISSRNAMKQNFIDRAGIARHFILFKNIDTLDEYFV